MTWIKNKIKNRVDFGASRAFDEKAVIKKRGTSHLRSLWQKS
jgi:hypothetical protein